MNKIQSLTEISHDLTYHWYMLNSGQAQVLFKDISVAEYIALHRISHSIHEKNDGSGRTYLMDIAAELRLTVPQASKMIGELRDKGLVSWLHDGDGSDGTYITVTDAGIRLIENQENLLKEYYGRVIAEFGQENMAKLMELTARFESVIGEELKEIGDSTYDK